ncbi:MAG TPA: hypothetical protein VMU17_07890, partial [Elusimicrobiota bacterium]|nr:hypothetical protein [Elusimicrobiota bacterium]
MGLASIAYLFNYFAIGQGLLAPAMFWTVLRDQRSLAKLVGSFYSFSPPRKSRFFERVKRLGWALRLLPKMFAAGIFKMYAIASQSPSLRRNPTLAKAVGVYILDSATGLLPEDYQFTPDDWRRRILADTRLRGFPYDGLRRSLGTPGSGRRLPGDVTFEDFRARVKQVRRTAAAGHPNGAVRDIASWYRAWGGLKRRPMTAVEAACDIIVASLLLHDREFLEVVEYPEEWKDWLESFGAWEKQPVYQALSRDPALLQRTFEILTEVYRDPGVRMERRALEWDRMRFRMLRLLVLKLPANGADLAAAGLAPRPHGRSGKSISAADENEIHRMLDESIARGETAAFSLTKPRSYYFGRQAKPAELVEGLTERPAGASERLRQRLEDASLRRRLAQAFSCLQEAAIEKPALKRLRYVVTFSQDPLVLSGQFLEHEGRDSVYLPLDLLDFINRRRNTPKKRKFYMESTRVLLGHVLFHLDGERGGVYVDGHPYGSRYEHAVIAQLWSEYYQYCLAKLRRSELDISLDDAFRRLQALVRRNALAELEFVWTQDRSRRPITLRGGRYLADNLNGLYEEVRRTYDRREIAGENPWGRRFHFTVEMSQAGVRALVEPGGRPPSPEMKRHLVARVQQRPVIVPEIVWHQFTTDLEKFRNSFKRWITPELVELSLSYGDVVDGLRLLREKEQAEVLRFADLQQLVGQLAQLRSVFRRMWPRMTGILPAQQQRIVEGINRLDQYASLDDSPFETPFSAGNVTLMDRYALMGVADHHDLYVADYSPVLFFRRDHPDDRINVFREAGESSWSLFLAPANLEPLSASDVEMASMARSDFSLRDPETGGLSRLDAGNVPQRIASRTQWLERREAS